MAGFLFLVIRIVLNLYLIFRNKKQILVFNAVLVSFLCGLIRNY